VLGPWWDSLEKASSINNWILGFAALFGVLAALLVVAGWFIGARVSALEKNQLAQFRTDAETRIAAANKTAAQANERATQMEAQTEKLRNENLEIQRKLAPRFLTAEERALILDAIRPYRAHRFTMTKLGDAEAGPYCDSIVALFEEAGWVASKSYSGMVAPPPYGVILHVSAHPDAAVRALIDSFRRAGIKITLQEVVTRDDSLIDILVGLKPPA
jgi:glycine/D-amino acid oxidase-like deaminating enzyme